MPADPALSTRAVAVDEALALAVQLHQRGQVSAAESIYAKVLTALPEHPDALHFLALARHQRGDSVAALRLLERALVGAPRHADLHNNRGNVLRENARLDEAVQSYRQALALRPDLVAALANLGATLAALGRDDEAVASYRALLDAAPRFPCARFHLGLLLRNRRETLGEAIDLLQSALEAPGAPGPDYRGRVRHALGGALYAAGRLDEAAAVFAAWQHEQPGHPVPQHMLAALAGRAPPTQASPEYVRCLFDGFAASFDEVLIHQLHYRAPELLEQALKALLPPPEGALDVLDAGCGTGLCAPRLRPWARQLVGVDLSPAMIERARSRGYDELVVAEMTACLRERPAAFDLVVAGDAVEYFGAVDALFAAVRSALRPGGAFAFTVERDDGVAWRLCAHGRYAHGADYLGAQLRAAGFAALRFEGQVLRRENGAPVEGWIVTAR